MSIATSGTDAQNDLYLTVTGGTDTDLSDGSSVTGAGLDGKLAADSLTAEQRDSIVSNAYGAGPGNVFDLNQMHTMVQTPAQNYAQALEELKSISGTGTDSEIGIATLTEKTTKVQVEQGKLEMINGIIKNAVNYLNNRARSLTQ